MFSHRTACGEEVVYTLRRSAKKNIIVRHGAGGVLNINVPPFVDARQWQAWLAANEAVLLKLRQQSPQLPVETLPERLWYRGECYACCVVAGDFVDLWTPQQGFRLPEAYQTQPAAGKQQLRRFLQQQAQAVLLPQLLHHAERLHMWPTATALSRATRFWGVCRAGRIRLNWRLIGAPAWVADYVCVHELCHLRHANHSAAFWALLNRHSANTQAAKAWLKQNGQALFVLD